MIIRHQQMETFHEHTLSAFEAEMVAHSQEFSPRLCEFLGGEQVRVSVRSAMDRAQGHSFTNRGPIRLFIELSFLFGSGFDTDPQYPWAAPILQTSEHEMVRAERLRDKVLDYQKKVSGPENVNTRAALERLSAAAQQTPTLPPAKPFVPSMLQEMARIFPEKTEYTGQAALEALISEGRSEARKYLLPAVRGEGLLTVLMFAFGHGCTEDPLYPWIARTLTGERTVDPQGITDRLEKMAQTWLQFLLAGLPGRTQS